MDEKEIRCNCGKMLAKIREDGTIWVWCKACKKEVPLEVVPYEPMEKCKNGTPERKL